MSNPNYFDKVKEFEMIVENSIGDSDDDLSANILIKISKNEILKNALFRITLFKEEDKDIISKHKYKMVKGKDILNLLNCYVEDELKFKFAIAEDN